MISTLVWLLPAVCLALGFFDAARWQGSPGRLHVALPLLLLSGLWIFWFRGLSGLRGSPLKRGPLAMLLLFGLVGLVSSGLSLSPGMSAIRVPWTLLTIGTGLVIFSMQGRESGGVWPKVLAGLLALQAVVVVTDFSLSRMGIPFHIGNLQDPGPSARPSGFRQEPGYLAAYTILLVAALVLGKSRGSLWIRATGILSGLVTLALTGSRMGQLAAFLIGVWILVEGIVTRIPPRGWRGRAVFGLLILALTSGILGLFSNPSIRQLIFKKGSFEERREQAIRGWFLFKTHPWFGVGPGSAAKAMNHAYDDAFRLRAERIFDGEMFRSVAGYPADPSGDSTRGTSMLLGQHAIWYHGGDPGGEVRTVPSGGLDGIPRCLEWTSGARGNGSVGILLDYSGDFEGRTAKVRFQAMRRDASIAGLEWFLPGQGAGNPERVLAFRTFQKAGVWENFEFPIQSMTQPRAWEEIRFRWKGAPGGRVRVAGVRFTLDGITNPVGNLPTYGDLHRAMGRPQPLTEGKPVSLNLYTEVLSEWGIAGALFFAGLLVSLLLGAWGWRGLLPLGLLGVIYLSSETIARMDLWMALGLLVWWGHLEKPHPSTPRRTLLLKIGAMGDVLMATPLLRALQAVRSVGEIHWLVGRHSAPVLRENPALHLVLEVDDSLFYRKDVFGLLRLVWRLRRTSYDQVVVLHRSRFYFWLARLMAPSVIGYRKQSGTAGWWFGRDEWPDGRHHVHVYRDLAKKVDPTLDLSTLSTELDFPVQNISLPEKPSGSPLVALNPGGGANPGETTDVRQWPLGQWILLGKRLLAEMPQVRLVLCGGPGDRELARELEAALADPRVENRAGLDHLGSFRRYLDGVDVFITGDTGGMHVAAAARIPVVAIFGPTDPEEKAPLSPKSRVVWDPPPCAPCYRGKFPGCGQTPFVKCLRTLPVDRVYDAVREVLKG